MLGTFLNKIFLSCFSFCLSFFFLISKTFDNNIQFPFFMPLCCQLKNYLFWLIVLDPRTNRAKLYYFSSNISLAFCTMRRLVDLRTHGKGFTETATHEAFSSTTQIKNICPKKRVSKLCGPGNQNPAKQGKKCSQLLKKRLGFQDPRQIHLQNLRGIKRISTPSCISQISYNYYHAGEKSPFHKRKKRRTKLDAFINGFTLFKSLFSVDGDLRKSNARWPRGVVVE